MRIDRFLGAPVVFTIREELKLKHIALGATKNDTDANLRARATHTGTQLAETISDFDTAADVRTALIVDGAPSDLNTLNELAAAINDDPAFYTTVSTALDTKVDKTTAVNGYALSTNVTLNKSDVGLGNVDNTSDLDKPISTATQTALDLKLDRDPYKAYLDRTSRRTGTPLDGTRAIVTTAAAANGWQLSTTVVADVSYYVRLVTTADNGTTSSATVLLEVAPTNSATAEAWIEYTRSMQEQVVAPNAVESTITMNLHVHAQDIPAGYYMRLRQVLVGIASTTLISFQEKY